MAPPEMLSLDASKAQVSLTYMAEGAANVVFRPSSAPAACALLENDAADLEFEKYGPTTPPPSEIEPIQADPRLHGKLIRLRKKTTSSILVLETQKHFEDVIKPLFPSENLVEYTLCKIPRDVLKATNVVLKQMEMMDRRDSERCGVYLDEDERYGCLITDMSADYDTAWTCFEFKPKWLVQSPSASASAKRCRTCALRAMRNSLRKGKAGKLKYGFCPLKLVSSELENVIETASFIVGPSFHGKEMHSRVAVFLHKNPLLKRLRDLQVEKDPRGVLKADDLASPNFLAAMTLRDCTLYLKVSLSLAT